MTKLIVDFRTFAKATNKRDEQRTRAVSGHTDGRRVDQQAKN